ncbi:MAG: GNAT family N-acetyltransferase [Hoeflea sp.]|nr:GNAT family N-acetyltransferase [Hoeflea sp.]
MNEDFLWRSEMACRAAWPAETEIGLGGWSARRSGGTIRRVNSLNPLPGATELAEATIDRTGDFYAGYGQPALVRLLSFAGTASADPLARRGYRLEGKTTTLCADLRNRAPVGGSETKVWDIPDPEWLAARDRIAVSDPAIFANMLELIRAPKRFAGVEVDGEIRSIAYAVIVDRLLVLESVATDESCRGRGLARQAVGSLLHWAVAQGIDQAVLQVVTDNAPARALYRSLRFETVLFDYFYMRQPQS